MKKVILVCLMSFLIVFGALLTACEQKDVHDEEHLVKHAAIAATCTEDGNDEYYECNNCGKFFIKEGDTFTEVERDSWVKRATGHSYGTEIPAVAGSCKSGTDGVAAHYECSVCHKKFVKEGNNYVEKTDAQLKVAAQHTYSDLIPAEPSTCLVQGTIAHYDCEVCYKHFVKENEAYVEKTDAEIKAPLGEHTYGEEIPATAGNCGTGEKGVAAHYECSVCEKKFVKDGDNYVEKTDDQLEVEPVHSYGEEIPAEPSTCETQGTIAHYECDNCHKKFVKDGDEYIEKNDEQLKAPLADHDFSDQAAHHERNEATCTADGNIDYYHCATCNKNYTKGEDDTYTLVENTTIDKLGHDFSKPEKHHEATFSCDHAGDIEYWECDRCSKKFASDQDLYSTEELGEEDIHKEATGAHTFLDDADHHHALEDSTCQTEGEKEWWKCTVCGKKFTSNTDGKEELQDNQLTIAKKNHDFSGEDSFHEAVAATCVAGGTKAYYECKTCQHKFEKNTENGGADISDSYTTDIDNNAHKYSDTACDHMDSTCTTYGWDEYECELNKEHAKKHVPREELDDNNHEYDEENYDYDSKQHWHPLTCSHKDDANLKKEDHVYGDGTVCETCGYDKNVENFTFELNSGNESYYIKSYIGEGETVKIPTTYNKKPVTVIGEGVFEGKNITSVEIPEGIVEIKSRAFKGTKLVKVEFPNSVLLDKDTHNYRYIFENCTDLEEVTMGEGVTYIYDMFKNCPSLKFLALNAKNVEIDRSAFYKNEYDPNPPDGFRIYVGEGGSADYIRSSNLYFYSATHPTDNSKRYWKWDENQENRLVWDNGSNGLTYTSDDDGEHYKLTGVDDSIVLAGSTIDIASQYNEKPVIGIADGLFKDNANIIGVRFIDTDTWPCSITEIGASAFEGSAIQSISIPKTVTTIGDKAFYNCEALSTVTLNNSILESIGANAFEGTAITAINLPTSLTEIGNAAFKGTKITKVILPSVDTLGASAFEGCTELEYAVLGESVTSIEAGTFKGATGLKRLVFGPTLAVGAGAFEGVELDTLFYKGTSENGWTVYLDESNNGNVGDESIRIYYAEHKPGGDARAWHFSNSTSYEAVEWDEYTEAEYENRGSYAALVSVDPNIAETVIKVRPTFDGVPVTTIQPKDSSKNLFGGASNSFTNASRSVTEIQLPDSITTIGAYSFYNMPSLKTINFPGELQSIGIYAFANCTSLKEIDIKSATEIGSNAFNGITFDYLVIPNNIEKIGGSVITAGMSGPREKVYFKGNSDEWTEKFNATEDRSSTPKISRECGFVASSGSSGRDYIYYLKYYRADWPESTEDNGKYWHYNKSGKPEMYVVESYTQGLQFEELENECYVSGYTGDATEIVIPGNYKGKPVTKINDGVFQDKATITKVTIGKNVHEIGANAFKGTKITEADLSYVTKIGANAFDGTALTYIIISNHLAEIGNEAFANLNETLQYVYFYGSDTGCDEEYAAWSLKDTFESTYSWAEKTYFYSKEQPTEGKWWQFVGDKPEVWQLAIFELEPASTGKEDEYKITKILNKSAAVVEGKLTIPDDVDGKKIVEIAWNYTEIDKNIITSFEFGKNLRIIGENAFKGQSYLADVILPEGIVEVKANAFADTGNSAMNSNRKIVIPNSVTTIGESAFSIMGTTSNHVETIIIGDGLTDIPKNAFGSSQIYATTIVLGSSVTSIDAKAFGGSFRNAISLYYKGNENDFTAKQEAWNVKFNSNCTVYYYSASNVKGKWHYKNDNADGSYTIELWEGLKPTDDSLFTYEGSNESGWIITGFASIPEAPIDLVIPATHESGNITEIKASAFNKINKFKSFYVPANSNLTKIGGFAFNQDTALETVIIAKDLELASQAFYYCSGIKTVVLDGVTKVASETFYDSPVETVVLDDVTSLENKAFNKLANLKVMVAGQLTSCHATALMTTAVAINSEAKLYFKGTEEEYSSADNKMSQCEGFGKMARVTYSSSEAVGKWHYVDETHADYNYDIAIWEGEPDPEPAELLAYTGDDASGYTVTGFANEPKEPIDLVIPATYKGGKVVKIAKDAFTGNANIKTLKIEAESLVFEGATSNEGDGKQFAECSSLTSVDLGPTNTVACRSFYNCTSLSEVNFGTVKVIGYQAFYEATLVKVILPETCTNIYTQAFGTFNKKVLNMVVIRGSCNVGSSAFYSLSSVRTVAVSKNAKFADDSFSSGFPTSGVTIYYEGNQGDFNMNGLSTKNLFSNGGNTKVYSLGVNWHYNENGEPERGAR